MKKATTSILAILFLAAAPAFAQDNRDHGSHANTQVAVQIPATLETLWAAIQTEHAVLLKAVESKADRAVHESETKLQSYVKALPEKVTDLEETKRKRIEGQARNLATVYDSIHHSADEGAFDKASKAAAKATAVLKLLEAQLPRS